MNNGIESNPSFDHVKNSGDDDFLVNKVIDIMGVERFEVRDISKF